MAKYHGRKGAIYASTSGSGTAVAIAQLNKWTLDMKTDRVETTAFQDANKNYVQGLMNISGEISGFWNDSDDSLFTAAQSTDGVKLYLYVSTDAATKYAYGTAWLDLSLEVGNNAAATLSGTFAAAGDWGINL